MFGSNKEYSLDKLKEGYPFDLYSTNWKITEIGEYNWNLDNSSIEYTIESSNKKAYLEVELVKGKYEVIYSEEIKLDHTVIVQALINKEINYNSERYELEENYSGDYKNLTTFSKRENLESYLFYNKNEDLITIEKWDDDTYEAFIGEEIKPKKIKNIKN